MPAFRLMSAGLLALAAAGLTAALGGLVAPDTAVRDWFVERRSPTLTAVLTGFTTIGSSAVLASLALGITVWLGATRHRDEALLVAGTTAGALILWPLLKNLVARARPDDAHLVLVNSWAYPSGHSLTSTAVLGVLAVLAYRRVRSRPARVAIAVSGVALIGAVGVSRVYLGVHWPTDVLAGWLVGALWLAVCLWAHDRLARGRSAADPAQQRERQHAQRGE
ncbi:MAG TPA: phosphatase PAP2 family protein [Actinophytocola sp.]|nr:phosphatase PAP2 family protein [Actinophytocola sp.]